MVKVYRGVMQTQDYIDNCAAANAYSSSAYPREYVKGQHDDMPRYARSSSDAKRSAPYPPMDTSRSRRDSLRRPPPPDMSRLRIYDEPPPRRSNRSSYDSVSTQVTPPSPPPTRPRRKSVRFDEAAKTKIQTQRPKTFATDAPPAAISESAKETSRRLFHRKPSDGGRPSARPAVPRSESTHSLNTVRAEMGTSLGRSSREDRYRERERDRDRREREYGRSKGRRR